MVKVSIDIEKFNRDLIQIKQTIIPLIQLGVIKRDDIPMIEGRIWDTIPKYVVISVC